MYDWQRSDSFFFGVNWRPAPTRSEGIKMILAALVANPTTLPTIVYQPIIHLPAPVVQTIVNNGHDVSWTDQLLAWSTLWLAVFTFFLVYITIRLANKAEQIRKKLSLTMLKIERDIQIGASFGDNERKFFFCLKVTNLKTAGEVLPARNCRVEVRKITKKITRLKEGREAEVEWHALFLPHAMQLAWSPCVPSERFGRTFVDETSFDLAYLDLKAREFNPSFYHIVKNADGTCLGSIESGQTCRYYLQVVGENALTDDNACRVCELHWDGATDYTEKTGAKALMEKMNEQKHFKLITVKEADER
jgi:hypothetical protein